MSTSVQNEVSIDERCSTKVRDGSPGRGSRALFVPIRLLRPPARIRPAVAWDKVGSPPDRVPARDTPTMYEKRCCQRSIAVPQTGYPQGIPLPCTKKDAASAVPDRATARVAPTIY